MYILLKTSFALAIPTILALYLHQYDVARVSLACLLISICNHSMRGQNHLIKNADILIQHGNGIYFSVNGVVLAVTRRNVLFMIPSAMAILLVLVYWKVIHHIPCTSNMLYKHAIMHVIGSLCCCCYVVIHACNQVLL